MHAYSLCVSVGDLTAGVVYNLAQGMGRAALFFFFAALMVANLVAFIYVASRFKSSVKR